LLGAAVSVPSEREGTLWGKALAEEILNLKFQILNFKSRDHWAH